MDTFRRKDLDRMGCDSPGCDHTAHEGLVFHPACHPGTPTWAEYSAMTGAVTLRCAVCAADVARIAVAP